jgi:hypothetical protein
MMDPRRGNPRGQKRPAEGNFDRPGQSQGYRDEGRRGCDNILSADGQRKMSGIIRRRKIEDSGRWTGLREDNGSKVDKVTLVFQLVTTIGREPRIFRGGEVLRSIEGVGRMWRWTGIRRGGGEGLLAGGVGKRVICKMSAKTRRCVIFAMTQVICPLVAHMQKLRNKV